MSERLGQSFTKVLKKVLENETMQEQDGKSGPEERSIIIYDYGTEKNFKILWDLHKSEKLPEKGHIIIVWDGKMWNNEPKDRLLLPHLTPMDWALAFSIKKLEAEISIHIVDLTGGEHYEEWAMRMRYQLLAEMPWVKLYAPLIPEKSGIRQGYNPIIAPACFDDDSLVLLEDRSDVSQCQELSGETSPEEASEGNQHPEPSKKPTKPPSVLKRWWDRWDFSTRIRRDSPIVTPEPASSDSRASSEETTEENLHQSEPSGETPKSEDSSGLRLNLSGETLKGAKTSARRNRLIYLAKQWSASLTQSDDHHDVNNVIGPRILAGQESDPSSDLLGAFCKRLSWCDLIKLEEKGVPQWQGKKKWKEYKPVSIFVIDDYLEQGWGEFVCGLLGEEYNTEFVDVGRSKFVPLNGQKKEKVVHIYGCTGP